ncbi:hypothetical protein [Acidithiobacillus acidisediminis]|uniref:hypothetical protein n=1 Tax=Acidithiobacillus acidisediminis TaxID=2937799 RepID=UPI0020107A77|nr:hypothetical protein [Acidithiobacillus sp. S30A2]
MVNVASHKIHGLFPFSFGQEEPSGGLMGADALQNVARRVTSATATDLELTAPTITEGGVSLAAGNFEANGPVWKESSGKGLATEDFYPIIRQIIGSRAEHFPLLCIPLDLAQPTMFSQRKGGKPRLWQLPIGAKAKERCRLGEHETLALQLLDARLYLFRTGIGILDLAWRYPNVKRADRILEGNYVLGHARAPQIKNLDATEHDVFGPQQLVLLAGRMIRPLVPEYDSSRSSRNILYSILEIDADSPEPLDLLTTRLSHRQTIDYQPAQEMIQATIWQPFPYVCHGASLEGGASVVRGEPIASDFLKGFVEGTGPKTYLPLALASFHAHFWLLNRTEWIPMERTRSGSRQEREGIEEIFETTVEYRRYFQYPVVSQISLHNRFHRLWEEALSIPERIRFQEQTAKDVAELIGARRSRWIGRLSGAVGGFLVTHEVLEAFASSGLPFAMPDMRTWFVITANKTPEVLRPMLALVEHWEIGIFLGSLLGAALGLWSMWNFDKTIGKE